MVPFGGWEMPLQYAGILSESKAVRAKAGAFDVSHMGRIDITGDGACDLLERVLSNSVSDLRPGRGRYSMVCNEQGGIIDDLVFYRLAEQRFLLVCNAANKPQVLPWIEGWAEDTRSRVTIDDRTDRTVMIALQGPATPAVAESVCGAAVAQSRPFSVTETVIAGRNALVGRTGYTGEDGFELILDGEDGPLLWDNVLQLGAAPCGLGARDVLRLEAGLPLHGNDIDLSTSPLEAGLSRFIRLEKDFVGAEALRQQQEAGVGRRLVGLKVFANALARAGYPILHGGEQVGKVTSGTFSPVLDMNIAMGYVPVQQAEPGQNLVVNIRGRHVPAEVVPLPFYSRRRTP